MQRVWLFVHGKEKLLKEFSFSCVPFSSSAAKFYCYVMFLNAPLSNLLFSPQPKRAEQSIVIPCVNKLASGVLWFSG